MKECKILQTDTDEYCWSGENMNTCVMAIALDEPVNDEDLRDLLKNKKISELEYVSICEFDHGDASRKELDIIKKLAQRNNVELIVNREY